MIREKIHIGTEIDHIYYARNRLANYDNLSVQVKNDARKG